MACRPGEKRYKKWADWIRDAEIKMTFLKVESEAEKISFIRSCAGPELTEVWEKEVRVPGASGGRI